MKDIRSFGTYALTVKMGHTVCYEEGQRFLFLYVMYGFYMIKSNGHGADLHETFPSPPFVLKYYPNKYSGAPCAAEYRLLESPVPLSVSKRAILGQKLLSLLVAHSIVRPLWSQMLRRRNKLWCARYTQSPFCVKNNTKQQPWAL